MSPSGCAFCCRPVQVMYAGRAPVPKFEALFAHADGRRTVSNGPNEGVWLVKRKKLSGIVKVDGERRSLRWLCYQRDTALRSEDNTLRPFNYEAK